MAKNRTKNRRINIALQLALAVVIFFGVNLLGNEKLGPYRFDLTEDRLFTLSAGTGDILGRLERPVTLKFFFSESNAAEYPELYRYGQRVEDFLRELEVLGGGKVFLEKLDPEAFSPEMAEAAAYGLLNLGSGDDDPFFLGLVGFDDTNRLEVVSRFSEDRERFLEYDLAKIIYLLAQVDRPKLGVISGLPLQFGVGGAMAFLQGQSQSYLLYIQLGQFFELQNLEGDFSAIPNDVDVLMVVHPPALSERQLFAVDQFVLSGKPALVFVDPFAEVSPLTQQNNASGFGAVVEPASDLSPLLAAWGVEYAPDVAVVDPGNSQRVEVQTARGTRQLVYPHWLGVSTAGLNNDDPVTAFLKEINFASAGVLLPEEGTGLTFTPLVFTSDEAGLVDSTFVQGNFDASTLLDNAGATGRYTLSARVQGEAGSAFPNGLAGLPHIARGNIHVIVSADADLFEDRFWAALRQEGGGQNVLVPIADNAAFVVNAIDHLAGSEGLVSLRARGVSKRPLESFQKLRRDATEAQEAKQALLRQRLAEAQTRLMDLEADRGRGVGLDQAREDTLREFRNEIRVIEKNLNDNQRALRLEIRKLENQVIFLNVFVVPALLILFALVRFGLLRRNRRVP